MHAYSASVPSKSRGCRASVCAMPGMRASGHNCEACKCAWITLMQATTKSLCFVEQCRERGARPGAWEGAQWVVRGGWSQGRLELRGALVGSRTYFQREPEWGLDCRANGLAGGASKHPRRHSRPLRSDRLQPLPALRVFSFLRFLLCSRRSCRPGRSPVLSLPAA